MLVWNGLRGIEELDLELRAVAVNLLSLEKLEKNLRGKSRK